MEKWRKEKQFLPSKFAKYARASQCLYTSFLHRECSKLILYLTSCIHVNQSVCILDFPAIIMYAKLRDVSNYCSVKCYQRFSLKSSLKHQAFLTSEIRLKWASSLPKPIITMHHFHIKLQVYGQNFIKTSNSKLFHSTHTHMLLTSLPQMIVLFCFVLIFSTTFRTMAEVSGSILPDFLSTWWLCSFSISFALSLRKVFCIFKRLH